MGWGSREGAIIIIIITMITTNSKFLPPLGAENSEFPVCLVLAQGCRKGDPQT